MKKLLFGLILLLALTASAQEKKYAVYGVAFYNLENLFDTKKDSIINDEEFTAEGANAWDENKYKNKLSNMAYVLNQLGGKLLPLGPAVIGVAEVENELVLKDLTTTNEFAQKGYKYVHYDSPDFRGIDVALLYNPALFTVESSKAIPLKMNDNPSYKTRDQLLVTGTLAGERIHIIVAHWPSRRGGKQSDYRERAAALGKHIIDSLYAVDPSTKVFYMGDLNDDPFDKSVAKVIGAKKNTDDVSTNSMFNPFWNILDSGVGSLAYNGSWNLFDQIMVSGNLIGKDRATLKFWKAEVFNQNFLINQDGQFKGYPKRTFSKGIWLNGYSDHLPTIVYLLKQQQ
jgi:hypothetical protein